MQNDPLRPKKNRDNRITRRAKIISIACVLATVQSLARADTTISTYYAPNPTAGTAALAFINAAAGNVYVGANVLSDSGITAALCRAETRGCTVRAVLDVTSGTSAVRGGYALASSGATVYAAKFADQVKNHFITSAGSLTMTGPYYWSATALQNGNWLSTIEGTATAGSAASTYTTLAASGTPFLSFSGSLPNLAAAKSTRIDDRQPKGIGTPPVSDTCPQTYFSPSGGCQDAITSQLAGAKTRVRVATYEMTNPAIAGALLDAKTRGLDVQIVSDAQNATMKGSQLYRLKDAAIPIYLDNVDKIMHSKYLILDDATVITGSYNFSLAAEDSNAENLIIITDQPTAAAYNANWQTIQTKSHNETPNTRPTGPNPPTQSLCQGGKCRKSSNSLNRSALLWRLRSFSFGRR